MGDKRLLKLKSNIRNTQTLLDQHKEQDNIRHRSEETARILASNDIDRRLGVMNEFREQLSQERADYITRALFDKMEETVDHRLKLLENLNSNLQGRLWTMGALVSAVAVAINLLIYFLGK